MSDSVRPHRRQPAIPGILQARTLEWVAAGSRHIAYLGLRVSGGNAVLTMPWRLAALPGDTGVGKSGHRVVLPRVIFRLHPKVPRVTEEGDQKLLPTLARQLLLLLSRFSHVRLCATP